MVVERCAGQPLLALSLLDVDGRLLLSAPLCLRFRLAALACRPHATPPPASRARAPRSAAGSTPSSPRRPTSVTSACTPSSARTSAAGHRQSPPRRTSSTFSRSGTSALAPSSASASSSALRLTPPCCPFPSLSLAARFVRDSNVDPATLSWEDQLAFKHCPSTFPSSTRSFSTLAHARSLARRRDALQGVRGRQPQALQERRSASLPLSTALTPPPSDPSFPRSRPPADRAQVAHRDRGPLRHRPPHLRVPTVRVPRAVPLAPRRPRTRRRAARPRPRDATRPCAPRGARGSLRVHRA